MYVSSSISTALSSNRDFLFATKMPKSYRIRTLDTNKTLGTKIKLKERTYSELFQFGKCIAQVFSNSPTKIKKGNQKFVVNILKKYSTFREKLFWTVMIVYDCINFVYPLINNHCPGYTVLCQLWINELQVSKYTQLWKNIRKQWGTYLAITVKSLRCLRAPRAGLVGWTPFCRRKRQQTARDGILPFKDETDW